MLDIPPRDQFGQGAEFRAALPGIIASLKQIYEAESIQSVAPEWTKTGRGEAVFQVSLPPDLARLDTAKYAAFRSLVVQLSRQKKSVKRMAHVEDNGSWALWVETD